MASGRPGFPPVKGEASSVWQTSYQRVARFQSHILSTPFHGKPTGIEFVEGHRATDSPMGWHFRLFHFFGWNWVFTHCLNQKNPTHSNTARSLSCIEDQENGFRVDTETWVRKQHTEHVKTNQPVSVGGKVLCYKYCRTPLSLLKRNIALHCRRQKWLDKPLVHVQETVKTM